LCAAVPLSALAALIAISISRILIRFPVPSLLSVLPVLWPASSVPLRRRVREPRVCACARTRDAGMNSASAGLHLPLVPYHPVPRERTVAYVVPKSTRHRTAMERLLRAALQWSDEEMYPNKKRPKLETLRTLRRRMKRRAVVLCRPGTVRWSMRSRRSCCAFRCVRVCVRVCALARACVSLQARASALGCADER
jgi:hypothetical protein